jgi:tRNA nucleotidyltransferase/poly(A) polymerase
MSLTSLFSDPLFSIIADQSKDRKVWLVGGALRDHFLGRAALDLDFTVDKGARRLARRFADAVRGKYYELDGERDTGRVILMNPDGSRRIIDFARLRGADIIADLLDRDFSINALAVSLDDQATLIDPLGGLQDLKNKLVKACSPEAMANDPIRLLRSVRIATQLNFRLERQTSKQSEIARDGLQKVSAERIRDELMRILDLDRPAKALRVLDHQGILCAILPELAELKGLVQPAPHAFDAWEHTLRVSERLNRLLGVIADEHDADAPGDIVLAQASLHLGRFRDALRKHLDIELSVGRRVRQLVHFAALYHDSGKVQTQKITSPGKIAFHGHEELGADIAIERARHLRMSSIEVDRLGKIVRHHMGIEWLETEPKITPRAIYRFFRRAGDAGVDVVLVSLADFLGKYSAAPPEDAWRKRVDVARTLLEAYFEDREKRIDPKPLLRGSDLISALELEPGPVVGRLLEMIREAHAAGEIDSREEAIALARTVKDEEKQ